MTPSPDPHPLPLHQSSTQPLFTVFGELVFEAPGWTASFGDGSSVSPLHHAWYPVQSSSRITTAATTWHLFVHLRY